MQGEAKQRQATQRKTEQNRENQSEENQQNNITQRNANKTKRSKAEQSKPRKCNSSDAEELQGKYRGSTGEVCSIVCRTVLHRMASPCIVLHCMTLHDIVLCRTPFYCNCVALHYIVRYCTALHVYGLALYCIALYCCSGRVKCGGSKVEGRVQWVEVQRTSMYTWPETFETCIHDGALDII